MLQGREYLIYINNNVRARKIRSWLTMLGIIIGIAAIIGLITLSRSMNAAVEEQFEKMGISAIRIIPGGLHGPPIGSIGLSLDMREKIEEVKGIEYVNPILFDYATVEFNKEKEQAIIFSYDTTLNEKGFLDLDLQLLEGRFFGADEKGAVILGYDIAKTLFERKIQEKNTFVINDKKFKVVGIFKETGTNIDDRVYMAFDDAQILFNKYGIANVFVVQTTEGADTVKVAKKINEKLLKSMQEEEFQVFTPQQLLKEIGAMMGIIQIVLASIASISLVVGAIGIMNSMFTAVLERTREIGVMKAIGAAKKDILLLFIIEAGFLGLIGGVIGTVLGTLFAYGVEYGAYIADFYLFSVNIDLVLIVETVLFSFLIGTIAGFIPAYRAASLKPVEALRYE